MKYKHADLIMQYAKDAMKTDCPWNLWEFKGSQNVWRECTSPVAWFEELEYRRKPKPDAISYLVRQGGDTRWLFETSCATGAEIKLTRSGETGNVIDLELLK